MDAQAQAETLRQQLQREINRAQDADRIARKLGFKRLLEALEPVAQREPDVARELLLQHILPLALAALGDAVEKCREMAGMLVRMAVDLCQPPHLPAQELWCSAVCAIAARFAPSGAAGAAGSSAPLEPAEELRLAMVETLHKLVTTPFAQEQDAGAALPKSVQEAADAVLQALPAMLHDAYPAVKKEAASMINKLCHMKQSAVPWKEHIRHHTAKIVKALAANGTHQQSKVRQATIRAIGDVLVCGTSEYTTWVKELWLQNAQKWLFDRTSAVRKELCRSITKMLTFRIKTARSSFPEPADSTMLEYLLLAMADDDNEVREVAEQQLRKIGEVVLARAGKLAAASAVAEAGEVPMDLAVAAEAAAPEEGKTFDLAPPLVEDEEAITSDDPAVVAAHKYGRRVLPLLIEHTAFWTVDVRTRALLALHRFTELAPAVVVHFLPEVLGALSGCVQDDDAIVRDAANSCSRALGQHIDATTLLDLLLPRVAGSLPGLDTAFHRTSALLILHAAIPGFRSDDHATRQSICAVLGSEDLLAYREEPVREALLLCVGAVVQHFEQRERDDAMAYLVRALVQLAGQVSAEDAAVAARAQTTLQLLAQKHGLSSAQELVLPIFPDLLNAITHGQNENVQWAMDDYGRQAFDSLVRICPNGATLSMDKCIQIISRHTHAEQQPELRLAMMALAETWIEEACRAPEYAQQFEQRSSDVLQTILMPGLAWKPGRVEATLRKVALAGLLAALKHNLIMAQTIQDVRYELFPLLKTSLDDHDASSRSLACWCLKFLLDHWPSKLDDELVRQLYPEILKRLDDSSDEVRQFSCLCLRSFLAASDPTYVRGTTLEYMLDQLFVHLDDKDSAIQDAVEAVIVDAIPIDAALVARKAQQYRTSHRSPARCDRILAQTPST